MDILYEDKDLLVCHKMPGIPVQTAQVGRQDMVSMLQNYLAQKGERSDVYVVHRLDQPVEGILAFARTKMAAASFSQQLQAKSISKHYYALAEGIFTENTGVLEDYLLRDGRSNTSKVVPSGQKGAKLASLSYTVMKSITEEQELETFWKQACPNYFNDKNNSASPDDSGHHGHSVRPLTYLNIQLETGRHHQIRVQMAHAGHPLVGDKKYNPNCPPAYLPIGLCSVQISFLHPRTGKQMDFSVKPKGILFRPSFALAQANNGIPNNA